MRKRVGNPFRDQHHMRDPLFNMRVYDFVTTAYTNAHDATVAMEYVVPELKLFGRGITRTERRYDAIAHKWIEENVNYPGGPERYVNGAVWTSIRDETCVLVSIGLYNAPCNDSSCDAGHMASGISYGVAPILADWQLDAIKEEVGEHPNLKLGVNKEQDHEVLAGIGFLPLDAPLKGESISYENLYRALDYLARTSEATFIGKVMSLYQGGYDIDMDMVRAISKSYKIDRKELIEL